MTASDRYSIPRSEWPALLARREDGETYAAIAEDYGVTGPTVRNILLRAQAEAEEDGSDAEPETGEAKSYRSAVLALAPARDDEATHDDESARDDARDDAGPGGAPKDSASEHSPFAARLMEATQACAEALDRGARDGLNDATKDTIKHHLHELRRAAAAIEIALGQGDVSKEPEQKSKAEPMAALPPRPHPARMRPPQPEARAEARPEPAPVSAPAPTATQTRPRRTAPSADGTTTMEGTVKFFRPDQGYGFVMPDEGGKDIYVPIEALQRSELDSLERNQRVRLVVTDSPKGPEADRVELISS